ncbi:MAG: hypothetical protein ABSE77_02570 [Acidimicrobiales bacterium]
MVTGPPTGPSQGEDGSQVRLALIRDHATIVVLTPVFGSRRLGLEEHGLAVLLGLLPVVWSAATSQILERSRPVMGNRVRPDVKT